MFVNSSQDEGGVLGVLLRVRILNWLVFSLSTSGAPLGLERDQSARSTCTRFS